METKVQLKYLRIAPRKVLSVARRVRGKFYSEAERELMFAPQRASRPLLKLLRHAKTNIVGKTGSSEGLRIKEVRVDQGPSLKRWQPRARGMASPILKRTSHVTLVVASSAPVAKAQAALTPESAAIEERDELREKPVLPQRRAEPGVRAAPPKVGLARRIFRRKAI